MSDLLVARVVAVPADGTELRVVRTRAVSGRLGDSERLTEGTPPQRPVLLLGGFPGGGTDLLRSVLGAHPTVQINGEMPFLHQLPRLGYDHATVLDDAGAIREFRELLKELDEWNNLTGIADVLDPPAPQMVGEALRTYFGPAPASVWGNKTPQNSEHIPELLQLFPDARFMIIVRDVRDVALSWRRKWGKNLYGCAAKWAARMAAARTDARRARDGHTLFVKYEELISDPETITRALCDFLDIEWSDRMLRHHEHTQVLLDGKRNFGREINPQNKGTWVGTLPSATVRRIEEIAFATMELYGYRPEFAAGPRPLGRVGRALGHLHDLVATLAVGNRYSRHNRFSTRIRSVLFEVRKRALRRRRVR